MDDVPTLALPPTSQTLPPPRAPSTPSTPRPVPPASTPTPKKSLWDRYYGLWIALIVIAVLGAVGGGVTALVLHFVHDAHGGGSEGEKGNCPFGQKRCPNGQCCYCCNSSGDCCLGCTNGQCTTDENCPSAVTCNYNTKNYCCPDGMHPFVTCDGSTGKCCKNADLSDCINMTAM